MALRVASREHGAVRRTRAAFASGKLGCRLHGQQNPTCHVILIALSYRPSQRFRLLSTDYYPRGREISQWPVLGLEIVDIGSSCRESDRGIKFSDMQSLDIRASPCI
jgi:hypothetical protein